MAILFMGGEQVDFDSFNNNTILTDRSDWFRPNYARAAIQCIGSAVDFANNAVASFVQPSQDFWFTGQMYCMVSQYLTSGFLTFLVFTDAGQKRLGLQLNDQRQLRLVTYANGVAASVVTTTQTVAIQNDGQHKLDVHVTYGPAGGVRVYVDQVMVMDYVGDITAGGSTSLSGFGISSFNSAVQTCWSECVAIERDSRTLMLKTHTPKGSAPGNQWTGNVVNVAETIPDDGTVINTYQTDTTARITLDPLPTANLAVAGFKIAARVSRGPAGPAGIELGVTTGGQSGVSQTFPVDTGWSAVTQMFETHPVTNAEWTETDINTIEIDLISKQS